MYCSFIKNRHFLKYPGLHTTWSLALFYFVDKESSAFNTKQRYNYCAVTRNE
jgi:hypothetical protein